MSDLATTRADEPVQEIQEITLEEGQRMLDEAARRHLNMTGEEFIAAWDEGRIPNGDSLSVQQVAALLPFGR